MTTYPAYCEVHSCWWDDEKKETIHNKQVVLLNVKNYTDAMRQIEEHYGEDLLEVKIELCESGLITFPIDMARLIYENIGN